MGDGFLVSLFDMCCWDWLPVQKDRPRSGQALFHGCSDVAALPYLLRPTLELILQEVLLGSQRERFKIVIK
jgi:hypothetical protein